MSILNEPGPREDRPDIDDTSWSPERKVVGAAVATLILAVVQAVFPDISLPGGVEGSLAVLTAYSLRN